jgi:phage regulator Rha-like protein
MNTIEKNDKKMSSREIAELTGSRHEAVKKSAYRLVLADVLTSPLEESVFRVRGQLYRELLFNKRDSLTLVAKLSPKFTSHVIDRWQELEKQVSSYELPSNYVSALKALVASEEEKIVVQEQLLVAGPKAEYHDKVLVTQNGLRTTEVAHELNMSAVVLNRWLETSKVQRRVNDRWVLTAKMLGLGFTVESTFVNKKGRSVHSLMWTEKGRKLIHKLVKEA